MVYFDTSNFRSKLLAKAGERQINHSIEQMDAHRVSLSDLPPQLNRFAQLDADPESSSRIAI